ncbi:MAG TPA: hypothetical protein VHV82_13510 [Sporichthyaceae bacterium]|nr:hypothetical protein [Sporichthyaceae bacterium]
MACGFEGATLQMGPGGYARVRGLLVRERGHRNWICFAVELVGCTFSGRLRKVLFNGTVPPEKQDTARRAANRFEDNDFSRADLLDVGFRTGIDLTRQRLPVGGRSSSDPGGFIGGVAEAATDGCFGLIRSSFGPWVPAVPTYSPLWVVPDTDYLLPGMPN